MKRARSEASRKKEPTIEQRIWLVVGVILILLGVAALVHPQISYRTDERDIQVGTVTARMETRRIFHFPRIVSGMVVLSGVAIALLGLKKD
ncbi:MAG: hypothetical protein WBC04_11295 [Candidatus Acidiferrales bacterium]